MESTFPLYCNIKEYLVNLKCFKEIERGCLSNKVTSVLIFFSISPPTNNGFVYCQKIGNYIVLMYYGCRLLLWSIGPPLGGEGMLVGVKVPHKLNTF